jgi:hypothetical protein
VARFDKMKGVALEQCGSTNEGEAQRLKQELNALKFNTMEVDVKCRFLQGASHGHPSTYVHACRAGHIHPLTYKCGRRWGTQLSRRADHCRARETTQR